MPLKSTQNKKMKKISDRRRKSLYGLGKWQSGAIMLLLAASLSLGGCKTIQYLPINTDTQVHYVDSIRYEIRDSVRITEATRYRDMAWLGDTLSIEGKRSSMWATADTAKGAIIGGLNEKEVEERTKVIYRDRWKTKDTVFNMVTPRGEKLFKISWFNASGFSWRKKVSMSMINDNKVTLVLDEFSRVLGFDYDMLKGCRYTIQQEYTKLRDSKFISGLFRPEETALEVDFLDDYAVGDRFGLIERITVFIQPSEMDLLYRPMQMHLRFELTVEITL